MTKSYLITFLIIALLLFFHTGCGKKEYYLTTEPESAEVYINKKYIGKTPLKLSYNSNNKEASDYIPGKSFFLEIKKEFFSPVETEVKVHPDKQNSLHFRLSISKSVLSGYNGAFRNNHIYSIKELESKTLSEIEILLNEIYAQYGKIFSIQKISDYFKTKKWYKENPYYDNSFLSKTDKKNIQVLSNLLGQRKKDGDQKEEALLGLGKPSKNDISIMKKILENKVYIYYSEVEADSSFKGIRVDSCELHFISPEQVIWYDDSNYFGTYYSSLDTNLAWHWRVHDNLIYVWDMHDDDSGYIVFIFKLDHRNKKIVQFPKIDGKIWK